MADLFYYLKNFIINMNDHEKEEVELSKYISSSTFFKNVEDLDPLEDSADSYMTLDDPDWSIKDGIETGIKQADKKLWSVHHYIHEYVYFFIDKSFENVLSRIKLAEKESEKYYKDL